MKKINDEKAIVYLVLLTSVLAATVGVVWIFLSSKTTEFCKNSKSSVVICDGNGACRHSSVNTISGVLDGELVLFLLSLEAAVAVAAVVGVVVLETNNFQFTLPN